MMVHISQAMEIGMRHHQAGQTVEAERIYRQVLQAEPNHAHALHCLGMIALGARQFDAAVELIGRAIHADAAQPAFYANLAEAYRHLGRFAEASQCCEKGLTLSPDQTRWYAKLGQLRHAQGQLNEAAAALREALRRQPENVDTRFVLGQVLHDQNQLTDAESCFRRVVRSDARHAEGHFNLGSVLQSQGRLDEAAASYRAGLQLNPQYVEAHNNLGVILRKQNLPDDAARHFRAALDTNPRFAAALVNLGSIHLTKGEADQAVRYYEQAVSSEPGNTEARNALGAALKRQGNLKQALECFQESLRIDPRCAATHVALGKMFNLQNDFGAAAACFRDAVRLDPACAEAYHCLGVIGNEERKRDEAVAWCRRAIEADPRFAPAYNTLAIALHALGRLDEALAAYRKSTELDPDDVGQHSNVLYALNYHRDVDRETIFAEHRAWGRRHADPLTAASAPHANDPAPDRRLRIGYLSSHFRGHAVNFFSEPILASHDHERFEIFCYSCVAFPDPVTDRLRGYADCWREISYHTDLQACESIRRDQIDILVDLAGHIGGNRLMVFAHKPAPIQVTYIGYQNTTGMLAMDYRLTDDYSDPPGTTDAFYTEQLVRLPRSFFCYQPSPGSPPITPLPALANGYVTFGSFNNFLKITPDVLSIWARLLHAVPNSRLTLLADTDDSLQQYLSETFLGHGIAAERLTLANRRPRSEYLELIQRSDIALDPFPFNGHTTTCDALWMGVPVISLSGDSYVSRFGGSALATLGLGDLIAKNRDEYIEIAAGLALDLERLSLLRANLRQRMSDSPLLDFQGFTRNLEAEYRKMWRRWCQR